MPDTSGPSPEELAEEDALLDNPAPPESVEPGLSSPASVEADPTTPEAQPRPDTQAAEAPSEQDAGPDGEPLPEFDPRMRDEFEGMLYLGQLTREFQWAGHRFVIRTLLIQELLEVALITKEYAGSLADLKAYQSAMCAGCVVTVDGKSLPQPLTMDPADTPMRNKFNYIITNWYPAVLDAVYEQFLILEEVTMRVLKAMADAAPLAPALTGTRT